MPFSDSLLSDLVSSLITVAIDNSASCAGFAKPGALVKGHAAVEETSDGGL